VASKNHRQGGKFGGGHTTLIDLAILLADMADARPEVTKISPGFIQCGGGAIGGERSVKILDARGGLLLKVRQNRAVQEVRIVTANLHETKLALARGARNNRIRISFGTTQASE
jgi:hypothetical protein